MTTLCPTCNNTLDRKHEPLLGERYPALQGVQAVLARWDQPMADLS